MPAIATRDYGAPMGARRVAAMRSGSRPPDIGRCKSPGMGLGGESKQISEWLYRWSD